MAGEEAKLLQAVSTKLPVFWPLNPKAWFLQAEAQFALRQITTDDTKYWHVVSALDRDVASGCTSILEKVPDANKYRYLKEALVNRFQLTEEERADRLLAMQGLGDRRPSELADAILDLNADQPTHFLLRRIFMRALPLQVRNALSTSATTDLRDLAREADRVIATTGRGAAQTYSVVRDDSSIPGGYSEVDAVATRRQRQLCFFHRKWGTRARRCVQPCEWTPSPPSRFDPGNAQGGLR